jgi:hypothetical protein
MIKKLISAAVNIRTTTMQPDLSVPLQDLASDDGISAFDCKYVHYGMVIMMVLIAAFGGFFIGIYCSVPMTAAACRNVTR